MCENKEYVDQLVALLPAGGKCGNGENYIDAPYFLYRNNGDIDAALADLYSYSYGDQLSSHERWVAHWLEWLKDEVSA